MNMHQLFAQGVRKIRLPVWNKFAYIELQEVQGKLTPFGKLYDIGCPGKDWPLWQAESEDYEEWKPVEGYTEAYLRDVYNMSEA